MKTVKAAIIVLFIIISVSLFNTHISFAATCAAYGGYLTYSACSSGTVPVSADDSNNFIQCCVSIANMCTNYYGGVPANPPYSPESCIVYNNGGKAVRMPDRTFCCILPPGGGGGTGGGGGPPPPPPTYNVTGRVYQAISGSPGVGGVKVDMIVRSTGRVYESQYTNSNGSYAIVGYLAGSYAVRVNVPAGYTNTTPTTVNISFPPNRTVNFGIVRLYTISGNVFNDVNKNRVKDGGEANVSGISMSSNGGNLSVNSGAGTYTITNLLAGTYNVAYTTSPLPAGYFMTWPRSGPPPTLSITVGPNCGSNVQTYGLTCNNGDVTNANFGISNSVPWWQSYGLNVRNDNGLDDKIPIKPLYPPYASVSDQSNGF